MDGSKVCGCGEVIVMIVNSRCRISNKFNRCFNEVSNIRGEVQD